MKTKILRAGLAGVILTSALGLAGAAAAGTCPAGKSGVDLTKPVDTPMKDVTASVIASIDVSKEPAAIQGRLFRLRRMTIKPGGVVAWHSHADRPAIIYIIEGTVVEYASSCAVPIVHHAGDVTPETHETSHWWKNTGKTTVVLLSADLFPTASSTEDHHMM